jgi:hypothetical protein
MSDLVAAAGRPARVLSPEVEAWRRELAGLWDSVAVSMTRFAAANPIGKGLWCPVPFDLRQSR